MGVYCYGLEGGRAFNDVDYTASWLYRSKLFIQHFTGHSTWAHIEGNSSVLKNAKLWLADNPGGTFGLTVSMLPGDPSGNPTYGTTMAQGALGTYNSHFVLLAQSLVSNNLANNTIIRLGHELNGDWYPWQVTNATEGDNYREYWKQIVNAMRGVSGASGLKFEWCGAVIKSPQYAFSNAYPGDGYVDYIGVDAYDRAPFWDAYPYPANATPAQIASRRAAAWGYLSNATIGLEAWRQFAVAHNKPFTIPEWGLSNYAPWDGLDNPYYVEKMYDYIHDTAKGVYYHSYFNITDKTSGQINGYHGVTQFVGENAIYFPVASVRFRQLFGLPPLSLDNDIGTVGLAGAGGVSTVTGAGTGYLAASADNFHFTSRVSAADDELTVQFTAATEATAGQTGVMLRQSTSTGAAYVALYVKNGQCVFQSRTTAGASAVQHAVIASATMPVSLRLMRRGNVVTGYKSQDGVNWSYAGTQSVALSGTAYIGVAVSSGSTSVANTATMEWVDFNDVDIAKAASISGATILDNTSNTSAGVSQSGNWTSLSLTPGFYGTNYFSDSDSGKGTKWIKYAPPLSAEGYYDVYTVWPVGTGRSTNTPVWIASTGPTYVFTENQNFGKNLWQHYGGYHFSPGTPAYVYLSNTGTNWNTYADAVMFLPRPSPTTVTLDNAELGASVTGSWTSGNTLPGFYGSDYLYSSGGTAVTFRPMVPVAGDYQVFVRWAAAANRATNTPITVNHAGGAVTLPFNQQINGGAWVSHGTYTLNAGTAGSVVFGITGANGLVSADAVQLVKQPMVTLDNANGTGVAISGTWTVDSSVAGCWGNDALVSAGGSTVTFTPTVPTTGNYKVQVRWTAAASRASIAPITVNAADGAHNTTVDQQVNGGQWITLSASWPFNAGTGGSIVFKTTGANGPVSADAVRLIKQ